MYNFVLMSKKLFEHYVNLVVTDTSINVSLKTEFTTYNRFANYLFDSIQGKNFEAIERHITPMVLETAEIMGLSPKEAAKFVALYFRDRKWEVYYDPVNMIKKQFNKFLVS